MLSTSTLDAVRRLPPDDAMPFLLIRAFERLTDQVNDRLADAGFVGIRTTHGFAMQAIGDGCSTAELGRRLGVSKQAASKTVDSLAHMGLVVRSASGDGRKRPVAPSPRGRRMLALSGVLFRDLIAEWRSAVGDPAVDATLATLAHVDPGRWPRPLDAP